MQYRNIIRALFVTDSCCNKCFQATLVDTPLLAVVRSEIVWRVRRANGDHTPKVSTTSGTKSHPTSSDASDPWPLPQQQLPQHNKSYPSTPRRWENVRRVGSATNRHIEISRMAKLKVRVVYIPRVGIIIVRNTLFFQNSWMILRKRQTISTKGSWRRILMGPCKKVIAKLVSGSKTQA